MPDNVKCTYKYASKTIVERELDKLISVCEHDIPIALDRLAEWIKGDENLHPQSSISLMTFSRIRGFLRNDAFSKKYPQHDMFELLLSRIHIPESQWTYIESTAQKWFGVHDTPTADYQIQGIVSDLAPFWSAKVKSLDKIDQGIWGYHLEFPDIHLKYFDEDVIMVVVSDPSVADPQNAPNYFQKIKNHLTDRGVAYKISIVLVLGDGNALRELAKKSSIQIVVIDEKDCISILLSTNSKQTFCSLVARRVSVQVIQPYQTRGKVRDRMFYGRHEEINKLKNNLSSSYAIYGGRLIGKSSLLHKIEQEFQQDENLHYKVCSITAQITTPVEACRVILKDLGIPTAKHRTIGTFGRLMRDYLESASRKIIILIDEVDDLIVQDEKKDYQLFEMFHNLNNDFGERCRFVFAGYRDLARHCMDSQSRFRNFVETIKLGNLSPIYAHLLIEEPLCNELGFNFEDPSLIEKIVEITGSHPNYIQVFCKELSEYLETQKRRKIQFADIETTFENQEFRARVVETFYVNFSPIQKLITVLVILENLGEFTLPDVIKLINEYEPKIPVDISQIYIELRQLEMSFILEHDGSKFKFLHKLFPQMLESREDLYGLADVVMKELKGEK